MKQTLQNRFPRRWLLLAFVLNFAIAAAALLPYMIRDGGLLLPDTERATHWLELAARRDLPAAQYALGKLFLIGKEVPQDPEAAVRWFALSAAQGNEYAQYFLDHMDDCLLYTSPSPRD